MLPALGILFILGLSLGSFLNACAYRVPRGISVVGLPARCPSCKARLSWWELIPVVSFAVQGGRCRSCFSRISWRYPLYEIFVAAGLLALFQRFGASPDFLLKATLFLLMTLICVVDWEFLIIPNSVLAVGAGIGVALKGLFELSTLPESLLGAFLSFGVALFVRTIGNLVFHRQSLGMGDVKLAWLLGLFLGVKLFLVSFWVAALLGSIIGLLRPKARRTDPLPFGSFLAVSSVMVFSLDESILTLLASWL